MSLSSLKHMNKISRSKLESCTGHVLTSQCIKHTGPRKKDATIVLVIYRGCHAVYLWVICIDTQREDGSKQMWAMLAGGKEQ